MARANNLAALPPQPRIVPAEEGGLCAWAPAKINLNLLVGPRGADGYHPLDSLVAKVTYYDRVIVRPQGPGPIRFWCEGAPCGPDEQNLAVKAARAFFAAVPAGAAGAGTGAPLAGADAAPSEPERGVEIILRKSIPPGKGLGGGSSDAAAVLAALNELWGRPLGDLALRDLSAQLGSDVPLFLGGRASRMTGRGERLTPIEVHPFLAVLILPDCQCATPAVYRAFDESPAPMGEAIDPALLRQPPSAWRGLLHNELSAAARQVSPELGQLWDALASAVHLPVCLSGSGSGLFVLCDDQAEAAGVCAEVRRACNSLHAEPLSDRACPGTPGLHAEPGVSPEGEPFLPGGRACQVVVVQANPW